MHSLGSYIRLYFIIEAQYIKARMHYRADFIISSVGMFFSSLATLGIFAVLVGVVAAGEGGGGALGVGAVGEVDRRSGGDVVLVVLAREVGRSSS